MHSPVLRPVRELSFLLLFSWRMLLGLQGSCVARDQAVVGVGHAVHQPASFEGVEDGSHRACCDEHSFGDHVA